MQDRWKNRWTRIRRRSFQWRPRRIPTAQGDLYALDGQTGKELEQRPTRLPSWNHFSGITVANGRGTSARGTGCSTPLRQIDRGCRCAFTNHFLLPACSSPGCDVRPGRTRLVDWPTPMPCAAHVLAADRSNISVESMSKPGSTCSGGRNSTTSARAPRPHTRVTAAGHLVRAASIVAGSSNNCTCSKKTRIRRLEAHVEGALPAPRALAAECVRCATRSWPGGPEPALAVAPPAGEEISKGIAACWRARQGIPWNLAAADRLAARRLLLLARERPAVAQGRGEGGDSGRTQRCQRRRYRRILVGYAVAADGQLHVVGLQSGKDLQKPAPFLPPNSQWSNPVAVGTMLYAATSGNCAGAPNGVYAIDLDAPNKPVVSYRTDGGSVVGAVAFSSDGNTLLAAIGAGSATGNGKANAIVALAPKSLQLKTVHTAHGRVRHRSHGFPPRYEGPHRAATRTAA